MAIRTTTTTATSVTSATCAPKPALEARPLIGQPEARQLATTFKVLANDSRLRLLHALARAGELCVTDLCAQAGMRAPAVSNQLGRLVDQHILAARRDGNRIYYRIDDPCVTQLLELGWCLTEDAATAEATAARAGMAR
jgi:DNA-binding transcriptional ArsR family regulator